MLCSGLNMQGDFTINKTITLVSSNATQIVYDPNYTEIFYNTKYIDLASNNRQIDRKYRIKLLNVAGDASIDSSRDTLIANVEAIESKKLTPLNDSGIRTWSDGVTNDIQSPVSLTPQDADVGLDTKDSNISKYTKLNIDGNALAADASDWACVKDNITGLIWASRSRIKSHIPTGLYTPTGWDGSGYNSSYGYNLVYSSFGQHGYNKTSRLLKPSGIPEGYCGAKDINIPTVGELQTVVDYAKTSKMANSTYFPNLSYTKPYLALKVDRFNVDSDYYSSKLKVAEWLKNKLNINNTKQWENSYLQNLGLNSSGLLLMPQNDTPQDVNTTIKKWENQLPQFLSAVNLNNGRTEVPSIKYIFDASPKHVGNNSSGQLAPYFDGELMYVIYPRAKQWNVSYIGDGRKDEDLSYIIERYFSSELFIVLQ